MKLQNPTPIRARRALAACVAALALAACDDPSLFTPPGESTAPEVTAFSITPSEVVEGDVVTLRVSAQGSAPITQLRFTFSGAFTDELIYQVPEPELQVTVEIPFTVPTVTGGTPVVTVEVVATDGNTQVSDPASTAQFVLATPPSIEMSTQHPQYALGDSVLVSTRITDPSGIKSVTFVGLATRGDPAFGTDVVVVRFPARTVEYPRTQADTLFTTLELQHWLYTTDHTTVEEVEIVVVATNGLGHMSEASQMIDVGGPSVHITFPAEETTFVRASTADRPVTLSVRVKVKDTEPISHAYLRLTGDVVDDSISLSGFNATDTIQTVLVPLPEGEEGEIVMVAGAVNAVGIAGRTGIKRVFVTAEAELPSDTTAPLVSLRFSTQGSADGERTRLEFSDSIVVEVDASDMASGLDRIGVFATVSRRAAGGEMSVDTLWTLFEVLANAPESLVTYRFALPLDSLYVRLGVSAATPAELRALLDAMAPDTLRIDVGGFAVNASGIASCAIGENERRLCREVADTVILEPAEVPLLRSHLIAVRGRTVGLAQPMSVIADLAIDAIDERLYLSNISANLVEVLQVNANPALTAFLSEIQVGSRPWGIFLGRRVVSPDEGTAVTGDTVRTLIVANSGGTNMSMVNLEPAAGPVREVATVRVSTPNSVIYRISQDTDEFNNISWGGEFFDFSDRPQFVAQDSLMRLVYSTVPTEAANTSTIRFGVTDPDPTADGDSVEVRLLLTDDMVSDQGDDWALANVDHVRFRAFAAAHDEIEVIVHEPGYPGNKIFSGWHVQLTDAVDNVIAQLNTVMANRGIPEQAPLYYPFLMRGAWDFERIGMSDTTFVTASADGGKIAIGEGALAPTGRIVMWHADECDAVTLTCATLSSDVEVIDLVSNASERVLGVGLNQNGSLGVARGQFATYFFTPDLRLQGLYQQPEEGGAGATFHPDHSSVFDGSYAGSAGAGAAFSGTSERSIDVVNTFHFNLISSVQIRDNIVGPLRAGPPLATDHPDIVAKLYGITSAGGVAIINVWTDDLEQ